MSVELGPQSVYFINVTVRNRNIQGMSPSKAALEGLGGFAKRKEEFHSTVPSRRFHMFLRIPQKCDAP